MIFTNELDKDNIRKAESDQNLTSNSVDNHNEDVGFEVTSEMLLSGEDNEGTMDEEEAFNDVDHATEIADLQKEGELPLEDILAMYYTNTNGLESQKENMQDNGKDMKSREESKCQGNGKDVEQCDGIREGMHMVQGGVNNSSTDELVSTTNGYEYDPFFNQRITRGLAALNSQYFEEDYSTDEEYQPTIDDWKKEVQIGPEFQAEVEEGLSHYQPGENVNHGDKLLWKPDIVSSTQLKRFLNIAYKLTELNSQTTDRDDEQILYTLLQTRDVDMALKRRHEQKNLRPDINLWSEEECQNFEQGLRVFGKDFRLIQRNKVKSRTIGEIVQFYYLWKKTERHDAFVMQTKFGRKKYTLPGIADMMGRFMEEDESIFSSRSTSPNFEKKSGSKNENSDTLNSLGEKGFLNEDTTEKTNNVNLRDNNRPIYSQQSEQYFGSDYNFNKENANNSAWRTSPVSAVSSN